ncbi:MAG: tetratricopeptide repeat protein [Planctomycetota bacterium]
MLPLADGIERMTFRSIAGFVLYAALTAAALGDQADDQYTVATGHYARQRWELAAQEFERFLADFADHPQADAATFLLGESLLQSGRTADARRQFDLYLKRAPKGAFARPALFRSGEACYLLAEHEPAAELLEQFHRNYPDDRLGAYVLTYLGEIAFGAGRPADALKHFQRSLQKFPQGRLQDDCRLGLARSLEQLGRNDEAEHILSALAEKPTSPLADEAQVQLGSLLYRLDRYDEAATAFRTVSQKWPESPACRSARLGEGWVHLKQGRIEEAQTLLRSLAGDDDLGVEARYWLAVAQRDGGNSDEAARTLCAMIGEHPQHRLRAAAGCLAGECLGQCGDWTAADQQFADVLDLPDGALAHDWRDDALVGRVRVAVERARHEEVDRLGAEFSKQFPKSALQDEVARLHARSLVARENYASAFDVIRPITSRDHPPCSTEDRFLLAAALEGLKRYDDALREIDAAIASAEPRWQEDLLLRRAALLVSLKRYAEAITPLEQFLALRTTGDEILRARAGLALCLTKNGRVEEAKRTFADLASQDAGHPSVAEATAQLAEAALEAKDAAWSAELFRLAGMRSSNHAEQVAARSGVAWSLFREGKLAEASDSLESLLNEQLPAPLEAETLLLAATVGERMDRTDAALRYYDRIIDHHRQAPERRQALLASARICDKLERDREAADRYERVVREYPDAADVDAVLYDWSWVLNEVGETEASSQLLERLIHAHPKSRFVADAQYRLAERDYHARRFAASKQRLDSLPPNADASVREHAALLRGQIAAAEEDWKGVELAYQALVEAFPQRGSRLTAEFWIAESYYRRAEFDIAAERFDALRRHAGAANEPWTAMIDLRRGQVLAQQRRWNEAFEIARTFERDHPGFTQQYEVDYLLGRCLHARAEMSAAREAFGRVIRSPQGEKTETAAMAQWMIGETYFHQREYAAAVREYLRLEILYAFPEWQAGGLVQAGKCQEYLGRKTEAESLYRHALSEYGETSFAETARQRLRVLGAIP